MLPYFWGVSCKDALRVKIFLNYVYLIEDLRRQNQSHKCHKFGTFAWLVNVTIQLTN